MDEKPLPNAQHFIESLTKPTADLKHGASHNVPATLNIVDDKGNTKFTATVPPKLAEEAVRMTHGPLKPPPGEKFQINHYDVIDATVDDNSPPEPGRKSIKMGNRDLEALLGRTILRDAAGKVQLTDKECDLMGTVIGAMETLSERLSTQRRELMINSIAVALRKEHGIEAAKRAIVFMRRRLEAEVAVLNNQIASKRDEKAWLERKQIAMDEIKAWLLQWGPDSPPALQRPGGSSMHKIKAAAHAADILPLFVDERMPGHLRHSFDVFENSFVVEHNWAAAFKGAGDFDEGEFDPPYEHTLYDFRVNGRRVALLVSMRNDESDSIAIPLVETSAGWCLLMTYHVEAGRLLPQFSKDEPLVQIMQPMVDLLAANVRAIAICLEAEVAETVVVKPDAKLNKARAKRGKLPLYEYHVIALHQRRKKAARAEPDPDREIIRKRCHFRRGHRRYYFEGVEHCPTFQATADVADERKRHKWGEPDPTGRMYCSGCASYRRKIKWLLAGDPDLGFVDKHYRLGDLDIKGD